VQVRSTEEEQVLILHTCSAFNFLLANFSHFSQCFWNQHKILECFGTHIQILRRKSFKVILGWNVKAQCARKWLKILKNLVYKSVLEMFFYTYIPVIPYYFLKKHNRCTLLHNHSLLGYRLDILIKFRIKLLLAVKFEVQILRGTHNMLCAIKSSFKPGLQISV
jgi:hypothetical protein